MYDIPAKDKVSQEARRKWLHALCLKHVETFLIPSQDVEPLVQQVHELESAVGSGFQCRVDGCNKIYVHHSTRIKYAKFKIYLLCFQQIPYFIFVYQLISYNSSFDKITL